MKKKILALCLVAVLLMGVFAGCSSKHSWSDIQKRGTLVVGTTANYPPHEYMLDGEFLGFDMDFIREMGDRLGLEVEFVHIEEFDTLLDTLNQGKVDCVIAGMTATAELREQADFSDVYYRDMNGIITQAGSGITVGSTTDLAGLTVGVQGGTNQETWLVENLVDTGAMEDSSIFRYEKAETGILDVTSGRINVYITALSTARAFAGANGDIEIIYEFDAGPGIRIAVQKDQDDFLEVLNQQISDMTEDSFIDNLADQWLA